MAHDNHDEQNHKPIRIAGQPIMVRPTLIVGLGGTGALACQRARTLMRELCESDPEFVRYMVLDSDALENAGPGDHFPPSDFYNLTESAHLGEVVRDCQANPQYHPHLQWLCDLDLQSTVTERGCQGISRLGRALFFQTSERVIQPAVFERLSSLSYQGLQRSIPAVPPRGQFQLSGTLMIHIVASVCGGTGAGMLLDFAYAVRQWAKEHFPYTPEISAHLVLPDAFGIDDERTRRQLQAVALTTLQQIEWLMDNRRKSVVVEYQERLSRSFATAPFTNCFLVNGHGLKGTDTREHLCELIGRTIRALTMEPVSQPIGSTANNMIPQMLTRKDQLNNRLLCFSSYGLHMGTAGDARRSPSERRRQAKLWLCESLKEITAEFPPPLNSTELAEFQKAQNAYEQSIADFVEKELSWSRFIRAVPKHMQATEAFTFAGNEDLDKVLDAYLLKCIKSEYHRIEEAASNQVKERLQHAIDNHQTLVAGAPDSLAKHISTLRIEYAALESWRMQLQDLIQQNEDDLADSPDPKTVIAKEIRSDFHHRLVTGAAADKTDKRGHAQVKGNVAKYANAALAAAFGQLADAVFLRKHSELLTELAATMNDRRRRFQFLQKCANWADEELEKEEAELRFRDLPYSSPLLERLHPEEWVRRGKAGVLHTTTRTDFHALLHQVAERFIGPLAVEEARSHSNGHTTWDVQKSARDLMQILSDMDEGAIANWLDKYEVAMHSDLYEQPVAGRLASHPLYDAVRRLADNAVPSIATDLAGRHTAPMWSIYSQNPDKTCLTSLMRDRFGNAYKEAPVERGYIERTGILCQVMRFCYGFTLEALSRFKEYDDARRKHLRDNGFSESDLWLHPCWQGRYEAFKEDVLKKRDDDSFESRQQRMQERLRLAVAELDQSLQILEAGAVQSAQQSTLQPQHVLIECVIQLVKDCTGLRSWLAGTVVQANGTPAEPPQKVAARIRECRDFVFGRSPEFEAILSPLFQDFLATCERVAVDLSRADVDGA